MFDTDDVDEAKRMLPIYKRAVDVLETVSGKKTEQAEQEPVMITPGGGAFPFAVVGEFEQAEQDSYPSKPACEDDKKVYDTIANNYLSQTEQAEQEPVAVVEITYGREPECYVTGNIDDFPEGVFKLYAAPVRTKDLTDDEIAQAVGSPLDEVYLADFRAVIAADREKNK